MQALNPWFLLSCAAQPAHRHRAAVLEQVKEVRALIRERICVGANSTTIPGYNGAITCRNVASMQKNSRPQAVKRGAGTDFAHAHRQRGEAGSEKRGDVKHVIGNLPGYLYRREMNTP